MISHIAELKSFSENDAAVNSGEVTIFSLHSYTATDAVSVHGYVGLPESLFLLLHIQKQVNLTSTKLEHLEHKLSNCNYCFLSQTQAMIIQSPSAEPVVFFLYNNCFAAV